MDGIVNRITSALIHLPFSLARIPFVKGTMLRFGFFERKLEALNLIDYADKVRYKTARYSHPILFDQKGQDLIGELITRNMPLMVSRIGAVELNCLRFYLKKRVRRNKPYRPGTASAMSNNAGFFPTDDSSLDAFSELYLGAIAQTDVMAVWFNRDEDAICNGWCRDASLVEFNCLEPFRFANPWSAQLAGRKVLVIHPFAESIRRQYADKRRLLFADPAVLPDFELTTIKAVQSIAGAKVDFPTWFAAYDYMCREMSRTDFPSPSGS